MNKQQLEKIESQFNEYAKRFFNNDDFVNQNLMMKLCHSRQVKSESINIAKNIGLDDENINIAAAVGLLHDLGRFKQFSVYKTYCDHRSVNHGTIGIEEILNEGILNHLLDGQSQTIISAIKHHNLKDIPADVNSNALLHSQIIRDSDKIDIFRVVMEGYEILRKTPEKFPLEIEFPDVPDYTLEIYDTVMKGQKIDYRLVRSMNDNHLLQAAWVYDLNFDISVKIIRDRGYIERLFEFLPQDDRIKILYNNIKKYMRGRCDELVSS